MFFRNRVKRWNMIKKADRIIAWGGVEADELFASLEKAASENKYIIVEKSMHDYGPEQVIMRFLDKYKRLLDFYFVDMSDSCGYMYIKLKNTIHLSHDSSYLSLEPAYTEDYYMNDCGGYDQFINSKGTKIDQRLQDIYNLIQPVKTDRILDIGCGRGELSFAMAMSGADVTGVDYSKHAIQIAKKTYRGAGRNLRYIQKDIFQMKNLDSYDKIVMADMVEHVEQSVLESIFERIADSMSLEGILVIHTAPNKEFYERYYPKMRQAAAELGCYLPQNPRSYYEQLMHINEQTPEGLKRALDKYFAYTFVWTGSLMEIDMKKSAEYSCKDNQIFAVACKKQELIDKMIDEISVRPICEKCILELDASDLTVEYGTKETDLKINVKNNGDELITSRRKYPIYLSYHILDQKNQMLVFDGERSAINIFLNKGCCHNIWMKINISEELKKGKSYILQITLVAEGCFWLDEKGKNLKRIKLTII